MLEIVNNIPDSTEIEIEIKDLKTNQSSRWQSLEQVLGSWQNDTEIANIFAEIDRERHLEIDEPVNFDNLSGATIVYLLDTNICIALIQGNQRAIAQFNLKSEECYLCIIVLA